MEIGPGPMAPSNGSSITSSIGGPRPSARGHGPDPPSQHPRAALLPQTPTPKHPTLDQLHTLGLYGMAKAFADLAAADQATDIAHADWLALLLDRETSWRRGQTPDGPATRRKTAPAGEAEHRRRCAGTPTPCFRSSEGEWIDARDNLPWSVRPASAKAGSPAPSARKPAAKSVRPLSSLASSARTWRLPEATAAIRASSNPWAAPICSFSTTSASNPSTPAPVTICSEILEELRRRSTVVTSQLPPSVYEVIGDPTYADAILDRLVHNAHRIELTGESLRRTRGEQIQT